jgi:uncharacterized protein
MKLTARNTHRDIAYFYLGLIIAFSFSGIFLNHRQVWHPRRYTYNKQEIQLPVDMTKDSVNDRFVAAFTEKYKIDDNVRRFSMDGNQLRISYVNNDVQVDLTTGKGKIENYRTSKWWIYYSDIFGVAMLVIAGTGMFIQKGEYSFWGRGWKLAAVGIIFPLIFLFLLS